MYPGTSPQSIMTGSGCSAGRSHVVGHSGGDLCWETYFWPYIQRPKGIIVLAELS